VTRSSISCIPLSRGSTFEEVTLAGGHEYISGLGQGKKWFQHFKGFSLRLKMSCLQGQLAAHSLAKPWRILAIFQVVRVAISK
jgi:hypothetical protein